MIASTLYSDDCEEAVDVDPRKKLHPPKDSDDFQDSTSSECSPILTQASISALNSWQSRDSAILGLASGYHRYPSYGNAGLEDKHLSTILEMSDSPISPRSSPRGRPVPPNPGRSQLLTQNDFELRSPTSIYSQETEDPFISNPGKWQDGFAISPSKTSPAGSMFMEPQKSPSWTVLNDPRAQDLPFMQSTSNGWTTDLEQFIYPKQDKGLAAKSAFYPAVASSLESNISKKQKPPISRQSSVERQFAAVGYDTVHAAIEKQQREQRDLYIKALPSPPADEFPSEVRARLGRGDSGPHKQTLRSPQPPFATETKQAGIAAQKLPRVQQNHPDHGLHYGGEHHLDRGMFPCPLTSAKSDKQLNATSYSPQRSPSRLGRLKSRLSRSPVREQSSRSRDCSPERHLPPSGSAQGRISPNHQYLQPGSSAIESPLKRGRACTRGSKSDVKNSGQLPARFDSLCFTQDAIAPSTQPRSSPNRTTTLPNLAVESMPRASSEKLWGDKGVLSRPSLGSYPSNTQRGRKTPLKDRALKLFKPKESLEKDKTNTSDSPEAKKLDTDGQSKFPISIERGDQMRLFGEVEFMLQTLANDFLLEQLATGRLSKKSIKENVDKWSRKGRAQVVDFCFDLRTQLQIVQQNLDNVQFHGQDAFSSKRKFVLVYAWKDVARELAVRSFCSADSAVKKMLSDCYVMLDLLGAEGAYWLIFQKLHVTTLDKIRAADEVRKISKEMVPGQTRQVVPGSPLQCDDDEAVLTNRHLIETI